MKPKTLKQIFDELAQHVSPDHQASFERLGRRLEHLDPDDEILQVLWFMVMHTDIGVNVHKLVVQLLLKLEATMKADRKRMIDLEKWMKILFWVFIGQTILLGIFVILFEAAMKHVVQW